jgi:hypothetical protein
MTGVPHRVIGRTLPPSGSGPCGAWAGGSDGCGMKASLASALQ